MGFPATACLSASSGESASGPSAPAGAAGFFAAGLIVTGLLYQWGRPEDMAAGRTTGGEDGAGD